MRTAIVILGAALAGGAARAEVDSKQASASDQKTLGKIATDWTEAWNRHDAEGLAGLYAVRGDLINPMGEVAKGRDQVQKLFQREHTGSLKQSTMALTCEPARSFSAEVAEVDCDFTLSGLADPHAPAQLHGHLTNVVVKEGQRWSIVSSRAMIPTPKGAPANPAAQR